jgi:hypothetical protein
MPRSEREQTEFRRSEAERHRVRSYTHRDAAIYPGDVYRSERVRIVTRYVTPVGEKELVRYLEQPVAVRGFVVDGFWHHDVDQYLFADPSAFIPDEHALDRLHVEPDLGIDFREPDRGTPHTVYAAPILDCTLVVWARGPRAEWVILRVESDGIVIGWLRVLPTRLPAHVLRDLSAADMQLHGMTHYSPPDT